nr:MAG TPA: hypothetical protein [Caudoviricetes sp.]
MARRRLYEITFLYNHIRLFYHQRVARCFAAASELELILL